MRRALALVGAVLLVAVAVVLRSAIDGDDDGGGGAGAQAGLVVACVPELRDACAALGAEVRIERPADTIAAADGGDVVDAWVTFEPWPEMARVEVGRDLFPASSAVARSDLRLVLRQGAAAGCTDPVDWACVVEAEGDRVAIPRAGTALGPLVLGWAALDWTQVTRPGEPFARAELDLPAFHDWLDPIDHGRRDPLADALQFGASGPRVIGTTAADAASIAGSREEGNLVPLPGGHAGAVAVVVAGPAGGDGPDRVAGDESFLAALAAAGWTADAGAATTGLPSAGVLVALLQEVS